MNTGWPVNNPFSPYAINLDLAVGRSQILAEIFSDIRSGHSVALVGGRKIGKTTVLRLFERNLVERLKHPPGDGLLLVPIYIDGLRFASPLASAVVYRALSTHLRKALTGLNAIQGKLDGYFTSQVESFDSFNNLLSELIEHSSPNYFVRLVFIFDEVGPIAAEGWGTGFFANWRSLLSNSPTIQQHLAAMFCGAREIEALARDVGSPLANILTWHHVKRLTYRNVLDLLQLALGSGLSAELRRHLFVSTGGHPFLLQKLLHGSFEQNCTLEAIADEEKTITDAHFQVFESWNGAFAQDERHVYAFISNSAPLHRAKKELVSVFGDDVANRATTVLNHYGVISMDKRGMRFRPAGELFRRWFFERVSLTSLAASFDRTIYAKLLALESSIADKYLAAWAIQIADLANYSGAVSEMRDVLTRVLHALATSEILTAQPDFKFEKGEKKPTRRQRIEYILRKRATDEIGHYVSEAEFLEQRISRLADATKEGYSKASQHTHVNATKAEAWRCLKQLDSLLAQLI